ncbi:pyridoxal phosphate-dependent transferase [Cladorrhinum samala]|uniref:Pyridoxal phosphate-dependent transferase n=1 Tax=Cladorrhinum samala TaxID=585594 RepID=A0AAV9HE58_9PEZI|nr:pyridoxal phosphate-dependent transferase [Cladorrhinum samala]
MATFDITEVRASFPALNGEQVYLDNAGGSQTLKTVADRIRDYLLSTNVQLGASYSTGKKSTQIYNEGYAAAAAYVNASPSEIVLGSSTTQLFRNLSYALDFSPGDELILSPLDHEANIAPWIDLASRQNLTIKWWYHSSSSSSSSSASSSTSNPKLTPSSLTPLLSPKTRLVACTHASNILGTIHDVQSISSAIRSFDPRILFAVDAVAYAPHRAVDVKQLGVDFYSFSWYKVYGPHLSILYASPNGLAAVRSLGHHFNPDKTLQDKLGLAGASYELVSGVTEVTEYLRGKWDGIKQQEAELQGRLLGWLNGLAGQGKVKVYGETSADAEVRVPTISFTVDGWKSRDFVEAVERDDVGRKFGFRWGSFYSVRLVGEVLGLDAVDGVVRVSLVHYNTVDELNELIGVFEKVLASK